MNRLILMSTAIGAVLAGPFAPLQTPVAGMADLRARQELTSVLASATAAPSAVSSLVTRTFAYYSGGESDGATLWAPITYATETYTFTSSGDYWRGCSSTWYETIGTDVSIGSDCPLWTTCSMGYLVAASTSYFCVQQSYSCFTELLYSTWAAENPLSWLYCGESSANATNESYYRTKPPDVVPKTETDANTTPSTPSPSPTPTPTPTPSPSPSPSPAPAKTNNAPVIAGSVVGGVAVIAIAAVAVFFILRRGKNKSNHAEAAPAAGGVPVYQPEKYQGHPPPTGGAGVPEYNPHASIYSTSGSPPPTQSPVPAYDPGWGQQHQQHSPPPQQPQHPQYRNELAG